MIIDTSPLLLCGMFGAHQHHMHVWLLWASDAIFTHMKTNNYIPTCHHFDKNCYAMHTSSATVLPVEASKIDCVYVPCLKRLILFIVTCPYNGAALSTSSFYISDIMYTSSCRHSFQIWVSQPPKWEIAHEHCHLVKKKCMQRHDCDQSLHAA